MKFPWIECADTCRRLDNTKVHEAHEGHEVYFSCSSCPSCAFVASCRQRVQVFLSRRREGEKDRTGSDCWRAALRAAGGRRPPTRDLHRDHKCSPSPLPLLP